MFVSKNRQMLREQFSLNVGFLNVLLRQLSKSIRRTERNEPWLGKIYLTSGRSYWENIRFHLKRGLSKKGIDFIYNLLLSGFLQMSQFKKLWSVRKFYRNCLGSKKISEKIWMCRTSKGFPNSLFWRASSWTILNAASPYGSTELAGSIANQKCYRQGDGYGDCEDPSELNAGMLMAQK